ncbi:MAG: hypothetical protein DMG05_29870 [Acidobacteria bacterium]|nr:MAG: hypothetical protein DMG05_29870 [Acidobacteriota bacterium]
MAFITFSELFAKQTLAFSCNALEAVKLETGGDRAKDDGFHFFLRTIRQTDPCLLLPFLLDTSRDRLLDFFSSLMIASNVRAPTSASLSATDPSPGLRPPSPIGRGAGGEGMAA